MRLFQPFHSACLLPIFIGISLVTAGGVSSAQNTCQLNSPKVNIKHVIYVQFDNTHFRRDNPNVPSDLEQMPHLLNFIREQWRADVQRPHCADLAHRDRYSHVAHRRLPGPKWGSRYPTVFVIS